MGTVGIMGIVGTMGVLRTLGIMETMGVMGSVGILGTAEAENRGNPKNILWEPRERWNQRNQAILANRRNYRIN